MPARPLDAPIVGFHVFFASTSLDDVVVKGAEITARDTRRGYEL
jgi:hypothetical protein